MCVCAMLLEGESENHVVHLGVVKKKVEKGEKSVNIRQKRKNKISIISVVIGMKKKIEDIRV